MFVQIIRLYINCDINTISFINIVNNDYAYVKASFETFVNKFFIKNIKPVFTLRAPTF